MTVEALVAPQSAVGPLSDPIIAVESAYTSGFYPKRRLALVRGLGARVWDADGNEYLDLAAGHGSANLGHAHPAVVAAITQQAATLITCPEIFYNDRRAELLQRLVAIAPAGLERAFLCNSGTEAVEAAIKIARLVTGRVGVVAAQRGFHGRTMGALSATWNPDYREPFAPLVPGFMHVRYNDAAALDASVCDDTAAVILEVVQGEGGVTPATTEFLQTASRVCSERGALLIIDEIQTGFGRTGRMFACEHDGVTPDLMTVAKSIAGGLPMGACLIGPRAGALRPGAHGSTFGGNPVACAAAVATLSVLESQALPARAARLGAGFMARLSEIKSPLVREVRGRGLMIGIDLKVKVTPVLQRLQSLGVLALPAGTTVLRLLPPLVVEEEDLDRAVAAIAQALND